DPPPVRRDEVSVLRLPLEALRPEVVSAEAGRLLNAAAKVEPHPAAVAIMPDHRQPGVSQRGPTDGRKDLDPKGIIDAFDKAPGTSLRAVAQIVRGEPQRFREQLLLIETAALVPVARPHREITWKQSPTPQAGDCQRGPPVPLWSLVPE